MSDLGPGVKNDRLDGKIMWELVPIECIEEIAELYTKGASKYAPNNWQKLENGVDRYYAALLRHLVAWRKGEDIDPDTKSRHLAAVAWNAIALMYLTKKNNE